MERIHQAFESQTAFLDLVADNIEQALNQTIRLAVSRGILDADKADEIEAELLRRERDFSTAIGNGVAVPHTYLEGITAPTVLFVRLARPINLGAPDGVLTRFLFVLIGAPGRAQEHLDTLTQIARLMADEEFRFDVRMAMTYEELAAAIQRFDERRAPTKAPLAVPDEGLSWTGRFAGGLCNDLRRKITTYWSDYTDGFQAKSISSTLFLYFACLAPVIAFGGLTANVTGGQIGVTEMLIVAGASGILYSLFAGQPLIILGPTGPVLVFTGILYQLTQSLEIPFLPTYSWVGLWTALFIMILAVTDASTLIRYATRFTDEIFAALISLIYIDEALKSMMGYARDAREDLVSHDAAFLSLILIVGTFILAMMLSKMRKSHYLSHSSREFLADFGPTIAVMAMLFVALYFPDVSVEKIRLPEQIQTTSGRPWMINLMDAPLWVRWSAAIPALFLSVLIYLTQNITARLVNSNDHHLQKGGGYHLDLAVISLLTALSSLTGLPWLAAATVRSLNHVRSLATVEDRAENSSENRERIIHVCETRVTGLAISVMISLSLLMLGALKFIPVPALYGLFLYMGVVSLGGNQFFERLMLWITDPELYPRTHYTRQVPRKSMHIFTLVQVICLVVLWIVNLSSAAILFPLLIALLIPLRMLMSRFFSKEHLAILDAQEIPKEEESTWI